MTIAAAPVTPEWIRDLRNRLRLRQTDLAQLLGVHWTTVIRWEKGELEPDPYRCDLMRSFERAAERQPEKARQARQTLDNGAAGGTIAALGLLLVIALAMDAKKGGR